MLASNTTTHLEFPVHFLAVFGKHSQVMRSEVFVVTQVHVDVVHGEVVNDRRGSGLPSPRREIQTVFNERGGALQRLGVA